MGEKSNDHPRFVATDALSNHIVFVVVLMSWLALSVIVVALLNVAKILVRSSARRSRIAASSGGQALASVDGRQGAASSSGSPPRWQPGSVALPPPQAARRSA